MPDTSSSAAASALEIFRLCNENLLFFMAGSFIVGSLFTILILVLLDLMRLWRGEDLEIEADFDPDDILDKH